MQLQQQQQRASNSVDEVVEPKCQFDLAKISPAVVLFRLLPLRRRLELGLLCVWWLGSSVSSVDEALLQSISSFPSSSGLAQVSSSACSSGLAQVSACSQGLAQVSACSQGLAQVSSSACS